MDSNGDSLDEHRVRAFMAKEKNVEETLEARSTAIEALKEAEEAAPHQIEQRLKSARYEIGEVSMELNEKLPDYMWQQAGAKHQIQTQDQDRYENRPEDHTHE